MKKNKFNEAAYLQANPDVAAAVKSGEFTSGQQHYERYGRLESRSLLPEAQSSVAQNPAEAWAATPPESTGNSFVRFEQRLPSAQTAVDVFRGRWASDLKPVLSVTGSGGVPLFEGDDRPILAANVFGANGRLDGMDVLELGPLEGGHTYQMERLGARSITAVEASVEAFLKCLIVKEALGLQRSRFLLGDIVEYLGAEQGRFDLVFCSGVLYHMADPVALIGAIAKVTDRCFVWSHYYSAENHHLKHHAREHTSNGFTTTYWSHAYGDKSNRFWGGNRSSAAWLERASLLDAFRHFGFSEITVVRDDQAFANGPNIMFCARRVV